MEKGPQASAGQILEDGIRYVLMRPDVLMGIARELRGVPPQVFLDALQRSAFRYVQASFQQYQAASQSLVGLEFISSIFPIAARLGWGLWSGGQTDGSFIVEVRDSPFAAGFGASDTPVCTAIVGILGAAALTAHGRRTPVKELVCAAQGAPTCRFSITSRQGG